MSLKVYNTLSRKIEDFNPITPGEVKMYCCGPTVYDLLHVGNFRGAVFYNLLRNHLENIGYKVNYVYNFTDIDDKIIKKANDENTSAPEIASKYIEEFWKDFNDLRLKPHSKNPRVTESLDSVIKVTSDLINRDKAYEVEGEVFYAIDSFKEYGKLSQRKTEDLLEGTRSEVDKKKRNPLDFTLWKPAKDGEQSFDSPWGLGRPGWHIECTAMIHKHLGEQIDIHGGGIDLLFPHHENEIAQAEGSCDHSPHVKYWIHNNMFTFSGSKMSKSLGNTKTMRAFLEEYHGEIFKFMVLSAHYRSEIDFSDQAIQKAIQGLSRIYSALSTAQEMIDENNKPEAETEKTKSFSLDLKNKENEILDLLNDDFATPRVFALFFDIIRSFNQLVPSNSKKTGEAKVISKILIDFLKKQGSTLSLFEEAPYADFLKNLDKILLKKTDLSEEEIKESILKRLEAKKNKDFKTADEIRDSLLKSFVLLKDNPNGTTSWEIDKVNFFK